MKYLVCFDGSQVSKDCLKWTIKGANPAEDTICIMHSMMGGPHMPRHDFETAERNLKQARQQVEKAKISCESDLSVRGMEPGEDIVRYARENDIDEIVIGVKRRSKVGKMFFGSTAQFVILEAHCPALTLK